MENEILSLLKEMSSEIKEIKSDIKEISRKLDGVVDQTANLTEFRTIVIEKLDDLKDVEEVTKENCYDIAKLKRNIKRA